VNSTNPPVQRTLAGQRAASKESPMSVASSFTLSDPDLLRERCLVGGEWRDADSKGRCEVRNPATGELLGTVPDMGAAETRQAIEAAHAAFPSWAARTAKERTRKTSRSS
jgi:succinate-semialdehyde dehydrogenase/glutarate-semialdehyde dehydrogenase